MGCCWLRFVKLVVQNEGKQLLPLILTSRKERQHYVLLKAVYSGTFQHACRNLSPEINLSSNLSFPSAPNCNPLYNPSTTPHQPSPCNYSPLARIITVIWSNFASWCTCTVLMMDTPSWDCCHTCSSHLSVSLSQYFVFSKQY